MSPALLAAVLAVAAPVPERLPAEVDDAYALRFNPAGLGRLPGSELRLFIGQEPDDVRVPQPDYGLGGYAALRLFRGGTFGLGFEADRRDGEFRRTLRVGFGTGGGPISFGFSYNAIWPFVGDSEGFWSLGSQIRFARWLAVGFATQDLAQSVMSRRYDTGLALRPWSRLTFSARWRYTEDQVLDEDSLDIAFRGSVEPIDGVVLGALADLDGRFFFQLDLNFQSLTIGSQIATDDGEVGFVTEAAFRAYRKPSLLPIQRVAVLDLAGNLRAAPSFSLFGGGFRYGRYGDIPLFLERLLGDDEVAGVLARIGPLSVGWASLEEVRAGLERIRKSGRRVDCQLTGAGDKAYFVASACSTIILPPPVNLAVNGVQARLLFVGEALERNGIEAEVYRRDEYKTSPETYTRTGISPAQRASLGAVLDRVQTTLVNGIASGRGLPEAEVKKILARGVVTATEAVALKLADEVMYPDQVEEWVRKKYRGRVTLAAGANALQPERPRWAPPPTIAVIHVDSAIAAGRSRGLPFGFGRSVGAQTLNRALDWARRNGSVRAVVLRVDSPGGGAFASDLVARAVRRVAAKKPVIASFGDVAASGGYYVASGATAIYAEPTTLTGSIGVFSLRFSAEAMARRFGISAERFGPGIGAPSPLLRSTPAERRIAQKTVDEAYRRFLRSVAEGRKADIKDIARIAGGRVWTGVDAKEKGLVDELGGLVEAIQRASREAGLDGRPTQIVHLPDNIEPLPFRTRVVRSVAEVVGLYDFAALGGDLDLGAIPWPDDIRGLIAPLLAADSARAGVPPPMAWFPFGLSVD